jgi:hypothetical protein
VIVTLSVVVAAEADWIGEAEADGVGDGKLVTSPTTAIDSNGWISFQP